MAHRIDTGALIRIDPVKSSNGATAVDIGPAAIPKNTVVIAGLFFRNTGSGTRTVTLLSKASTKILGVFDLAASPCTAIIDGRAGRYESDVGDSLQFKVDAGGGTDVVCSGSVVQHQ